MDFFIMASGAGDGHLAFNPPGSARDTRTRIVKLSEQTRRDNMATCPAFKTFGDVPGHGISLGVGTIAEARAGAMILTGVGKRNAFHHIATAGSYDSEWPSTIVHEMAGAELLVDKAASERLG